MSKSAPSNVHSKKRQIAKRRPRLTQKLYRCTNLRRRERRVDDREDGADGAHREEQLRVLGGVPGQDDDVVPRPHAAADEARRYGAAGAVQLGVGEGLGLPPGDECGVAGVLPACEVEELAHVCGWEGG